MRANKNAIEKFSNPRPRRRDAIAGCAASSGNFGPIRRKIRIGIIRRRPVVTGSCGFDSLKRPEGGRHWRHFRRGRRRRSGSDAAIGRPDTGSTTSVNGRDGSRIGNGGGGAGGGGGKRCGGSVSGGFGAIGSAHGAVSRRPRLRTRRCCHRWRQRR